MGYEVEVKYRLVDHAQLRERLESRGACREPAVVQADIYLSHPSRDFRLTNEAFRIRRIGDENRITYKGPRRSGPTKTREEIEIAFSGEMTPSNSCCACSRIWDSRRLPPFARFDCRCTCAARGSRSRWRSTRSPAWAILQRSRRSPPMKPRLPAAQQAVLALATELGLTEVEPRSYLRMWLESVEPVHGASSTDPGTGGGGPGEL